MDAAETTASFFPPPPPRHSLFTFRNLSLANSLAPDLPQHDALLSAGATEDEAASLEHVDLKTLVEPPRLDWIEENGGWTAFGEWEAWPGQEPRPALEGMPKLYPEGSRASGPRLQRGSR